MIATPLGDGLHELETPSGLRIKTALPADRLKSIGYEIAPPPGAGPDLRLAENDATDDPDDRTVVNGRIPALEKRATASDAKATVYDVGAGGELTPQAAPAEAAPAERAPRGVSVGPDGEYVKAAPPEKSKGARRDGGGETELELRTTPQQHYAPAKAQDVRVGYSTHTNAATPMLPEINKTLESAEGMREQALQQKAMAEGVGAGEQSQLVGSEAERYQRAIAAQEARTRELQARQADYEQRQAKLDAEREATDKLEVDPNRLTTNQGFFAKAASIIGLLAGGALSGMKGGPNQAAEYLHRAIREDIEDQRSRIQAREKGLSVRQTQLERLTDLLHGDQQLAERELEAQHLAHFAARAQKIAADSGSRQVQGNLMGAVADAQQKSAETRGEVNAKFGEQRAETFKRIVTGGPPAAHKLSPAEVQALEGVRAARAANGRVRATWEKGGRGGVYRTGIGASSTSHQMDAEAESAAAAIAKARGGRVNSEMLDRIKKGYLSASPEVIGQHLDATDRELADREAAILSGASGGGAAEPGVPSARPDTGEEEEP